MPEHSPDSVEVLPIAALVRDVVDASKLNVSAYAKQHGISRTTLNHYYNLTVPLGTSTRKSTLHTLALALDLPLSTVQRAADASLDRVARGGPDATAIEALFAWLGTLSPEHLDTQVRQLMKLLSEYLPDAHPTNPALDAQLTAEAEATFAAEQDAPSRLPKARVSGSHPKRRQGDVV